MKVTHNWLKDFVDIEVTPRAIADKLTMAGLEVVSLERRAGDYVFEIEITSNRPDWLSVVGIAREVAAVTRKKLRLRAKDSRPKIQDSRLKTQDQNLSVKVEDKKACPLYSARIIRNIKVKPSPRWLAKRLQAIGLRPVNNIVDITNYILFVTGQPLHAFDLDKIVSQLAGYPVSQLDIVVRRATEAEEIITIDGVKRMLNKEILVIASEMSEKTGRLANRQTGKPIAIAGIMGGKESEAGSSTSNIILESAYFSPLIIRRAGRLLALSSDSSYRFERSVDIAKVVDCSNQAAALILDIAGGEICELYKAQAGLSGGGSQTPYAKKTIFFNPKSTNRLLEAGLSTPKIKSILKTLEFKVALAKGGILKIEPPTFRQDVKCEEDLLEEICRIYGYDNIPLTQVAVKPQSISEDKLLFLQQRVREILVGLGFSEAVNYSLVGQESLKKAGINLDDSICLENYLSLEQEALRPALTSGLLGNLSRNLELGSEDCSFFEIGNCFRRGSETRVLGLIVNKMAFLELKGVIELLLLRLGIRDYQFSATGGPGQLGVLRIAGKESGFVAKVNEEVLSQFKIDSRDVFLAELGLEKLKVFEGAKARYKALPRYPSLLYDLSLVVDENILYARVTEEIRNCKIGNLKGIKYKDVYRSSDLGAGKKSITVSLEFRSDGRTLTDKEVSSYIAKITEVLGKSLNVSIR